MPNADVVALPHSAARSQRDLLGRLLEVMPVLVVRFDPALARVVVNPHFTHVLGWTNDDAATLDLVSACYREPDLRERALDFMRSCNGEWCEFPTQAKNGAVCQVQWTNLKLAPDLVIGIGFDVTAMRTAERELEAANARLREATIAGGLGIHEYFPAEDRLVWDAQLRQWWGLGDDEVVTYEKFVARIHPDDRAAMQAAVDRSLDPIRGGRYEAEYRVVHPDGTLRWMHATGSITFEAGRAVRLTGTVQDISRNTRLAEQLRAADRRKDVFLATLSHELRNPLTPIRTAAKLLAMPDIGQTRRTQAQAIIQRQSAHMAWLLDDLLDVSRITQGKLSLRREPVSLAGAVDAAMETAQPQIERKQHSISIALPEADVTLDADPVRLTQVLSNLLTNAAKYTDAGGHIELKARVDDATLVVEVRDNGIGIEPHVVNDVFEMFSQVDGAHQRAEGGLGIGLALVKGLVELHGGSVTAHSDGPGQGSTFTVSLPIQG